MNILKYWRVFNRSNMSKRINENQILRDLAKILLRDYVGDLCFLSNKSLELDSEEYGKFIKEFATYKVNELDKYYDGLVSKEGEQPIDFYIKMFEELKDPIKSIETS